MRKYAVILWLITLCLSGAARPGAAQSVTQVSTLTSTTTGDVLQLRATVVPVPGTDRFDWSYRLTNPAGNSVQIDTFSVALQASLQGLSSVRTPMGWYPARQEGPEDKVVWRLVPGDPSNRVNREGPLTPGEMFLFEFELGLSGVPNAGSVSASGTAFFSAASLGAAAGGPAQAVPEPGTLCLLGIGLGPLLLLPKRRLLPR